MRLVPAALCLLVASCGGTGPADVRFDPTGGPAPLACDADFTFCSASTSPAEDILSAELNVFIENASSKRITITAGLGLTDAFFSYAEPDETVLEPASATPWRVVVQDDTPLDQAEALFSFDATDVDGDNAGHLTLRVYAAR